jgi:hypothetical protein
LLKVPHEEPLQPPPERLQVTPLFWVSFCRVAVKPWDFPTCKVLEDGETATDTCVTENATPLLVNPFTVMLTLPVVAPLGTVATTAVELQLVVFAETPLKATALVPFVAPKFVPLMVTELPTGPEAGDIPAMAGVVVGLCELADAPPVLNAATVAIQLPAGLRVQEAAMEPALAWLVSSSA